MNKRIYEAFTLVEMLIVMGILIILMVIGVAAGRFAINRANDVAHQNAADQIYVSLQAYYTDERSFPTTNCGVAGTEQCNAFSLVGTPEDPGLLGAEGYLDVGTWNGGSPSSYIYFVGGDNNDQAVLVCVSLRGTSEAQTNRGSDEGMWYCAGNGFNVDVSTFTPVLPFIITEQVMEEDADAAALNGVPASDWDGGWDV